MGEIDFKGMIYGVKKLTFSLKKRTRFLLTLSTHTLVNTSGFPFA